MDNQLNLELNFIEMRFDYLLLMPLRCYSRYHNKYLLISDLKSQVVRILRGGEQVRSSPIIILTNITMELIIDDERRLWILQVTKSNEEINIVMDMAVK